jgi:hypothetical protein
MPAVGERWAYREKPRTSGGAFHPVEVVQVGPTKSRKVRIRWLDGEYRGLDEWVSSARLVVPWVEVDDFVADERRVLALTASQPERLDDATVLAVHLLACLECTPALTFHAEVGHPVTCCIEEFANLGERLPVSPESLLGSPAAFVDRAGALHLGQQATVALSQAICASRPDEVMALLTEELEGARHAVTTGWYPASGVIDAYPVSRDLARERLAELDGLAPVVRKWCGVERAESFDERERLRAEVLRLQRIIEEAAYLLREVGYPLMAKSVVRKYKKGCGAEAG